ncbi:MAG TPA: MFS transporter [Candidatus Deferrimicrobiaceae bacterium]|jgi:MFS family permease
MAETRTKSMLHRFMLLSILGGMGMGVSQIAVTLYAVSLGADASQIGLIGGIQGVGLLLTVLPVGFLVDRFGPRVVFLFGGLMSALIYLAFPYVRTAQLLIAFVAVIGFFTSFRFISMSSVFLEFLESCGNEKAGWQRGSHSTGLVFLGPMAGAFLARHAGYTATFYAVSGSLVALILGAAVVFPGRPNEPSRHSFRETLAHIGGMFKDRNLVEASLAEGLALATFSCFNAFIVVIAIRTFGLSAQGAAMFVSLEGIVFIATLFSLWRLVARLGQRRFYLLSIGILVAGLSLLSISRHPAFPAAGTVLVGIGLGMFNLVNVTRIGATPGRKGKVAGLFALFTVGGSILGPIAGGYIGKAFGPGAIFPAFIPLFLAFGLRLHLRGDDEISFGGTPSRVDHGAEGAAS